MSLYFSTCLLVFPILWSTTFALTLPEERLSCKEQPLIYIPNSLDYYEEVVEVTFNSAHSFNTIPLNQIVAEECELRDPMLRAHRLKRSTSSMIAKGVHHLSKLVRHLLQRGKSFLSPTLLRRLYASLEKVALAKAIDKSIDFWQYLWKNPEEVKREENVEEMLESVFRASLQMLRQDGQLSELMLHHPDILEKIRRRLPLGNAMLLAEVSALNVECHASHRDSQVTIFMKLRIPKTKEVLAEQCDDIGIIKLDTYQYYALPNMTFSRDGETLQVHTEQCRMEDFLYCPAASMEPAKCSRSQLEYCEKIVISDARNFSRQLARGFAVFGDFRQIISKEGDLYSQMSVKPRRLHLLVPKVGQTLVVGDQEFVQHNDHVATVVRELQ